MKIEETGVPRKFSTFHVLPDPVENENNIGEYAHLATHCAYPGEQLLLVVLPKEKGVSCETVKRIPSIPLQGTFRRYD